ncbi:hypothetical protein DNTS_016687 [Danionella cerebrum]|uniref:G-patch domain-containing protein n=1 Tax=Danionella cerebrum TaxID=2873325 RepID=A0A553QEC8_9TELE|nr:hypothetical protein DNTS_016687 [Danionella translucida]
MAALEQLEYLVVNNIPSKFRSADLRNFFSQFIEREGFVCFHYRHRPELRVPLAAQDDLAPGADGRGGSAGEKTCCCVVSVRSRDSQMLIKMFTGKNWIDSSGNWLKRTCLIRRIRVSEQSEPESFPYKTKAEMRRHVAQSEHFSLSDLKVLPELNPPDLMPSGNVGTPIRVFLQLIQSCRLPPRLIRKLGLSFPKTCCNRRYGNVHYEYKNTTIVTPEEESVFTAGGVEISGPVMDTLTTKAQKIKSTPTVLKQNQDKRNDMETISCETTLHMTATSRREEGLPSTSQTRHTPENSSQTHDFPSTSQSADEKPCSSTACHLTTEEGDDKELSGPDDDDDRCEEWERHESLHEDVTSQERSKERLFEEEIELKWEKGGSGLVFYTDAQFWQEETEGDFDEQTADDWDVDMSIYYDKDGGDMDARDFIRMRSEQRLRDGLDKQKGAQHSIGRSQRFGYGRRLMEQQGWRDGQGLGSSSIGIKDALENEGQLPHSKRGFGYHGEKLSSFLPVKRARKDFNISTIYDEPKDIDKGDEILRRQPNTSMKFRRKRGAVRINHHH